MFVLKKKYTCLVVIFLIVASCAAFGRILGNDFINFDDNKYITENNHIKEGINTKSIEWAFTTAYFSYWHPLTWLSHTLDWSLFGANASGHHLVSLLWHIGSAILLFLFLNKTTGSLWPSAFVAALFALHPLRVESVAWASERKDVLSVFFGLASIYAYAYYVESSKLSKYFLCLILFALSLMAKPMLVTLPFIMLLLDYWPLGRWQKVLVIETVPILVNKGVGKKKTKERRAESSVEKKTAKPVKNGRQLIGNLLWEKVPFIFLAMILSIALIWQQQAAGGMVSIQQISFSDRIINAIVSYVSYVGKTFWPVDLAVFYPYEHSFPIWQILSASLILLGVSIVVVYFAKRTPFFAIGWLWYLSTLFPVIGLLQAGAQAMADRYTYFPSIGIAIIVAWGIVYLLPKEKMRKIIIFPAAIILAALTFLTWQQCGYWNNSIELFNHTLQVTKDNYLAQTNLGVALDAKGKNDQALAHYLSALKINPHYDKAHYNLAMVFKEQGNIEASLKHFQETLLINPNFPDAHNNIGIILEKYFKKYEEAIYHYEQELKITPDNPGTHFNLGIALAIKGNLKEAAEHFRQAIDLKPDYEDARRALKLALEMDHQKR